jgi:hypothetical protein
MRVLVNANHAALFVPVDDRPADLNSFAIIDLSVGSRSEEFFRRQFQILHGKGNRVPRRYDLRELTVTPPQGKSQRNVLPEDVSWDQHELQ